MHDRTGDDTTHLDICLVAGKGAKWQKFCVMLGKNPCSKIDTLRGTHFYPGYIPLFSQQQEQWSPPFQGKQRQYRLVHNPSDASEYKDIFCLIKKFVPQNTSLIAFAEMM